MSASKPEADDEEEDVEKKNSARKQIDIRESGRSVLITQECFDFFYNMDSSM